jgi:hypothetical protein
MHIANEVEPLLKLYQTDAPMLLFLGADLFTLKSVLQRFVQDSMTADIKTEKQIFRLHLEDKSILKDSSQINVGFVAKQILVELRKPVHGRGKVSERDVLTFRMEMQEFPTYMVHKLLEKAPLKYSLVQNMTWFHPQGNVSQPTKCQIALEACLKLMVNDGYVQRIKCDLIIREYQLLMDTVSEEEGSNPFRSFNKETDRLDKFYHSLLASTPQYGNLWPVVRILLSLSHGQASAERRFSVSKELVVQNQKEEKSLIARRLVNDHIKDVGCVCNIDVNQTRLQYASKARHQYRTSFEEAAALKRDSEGALKRKAVEDEVEGLKRKRHCLEKDISSWLKDADDHAERAEMSQDFSWISKSNALLRSAKQKEIQLREIEANRFN